MCLATLLAVLAVQYSTRPFIETVQQETVDDEAKLRAWTIKARLEGVEAYLRYLADSPEVVALALGDVEHPGAVTDRLDVSGLPEGVARIAIVDFLADQLLVYPTDNTGPETAFTASRYAAPLNRLTQTNAKTSSIYDVQKRGQVHWLKIVVPIINFDRVEGVVLADVPLSAELLNSNNGLVTSVDLSFGTNSAEPSADVFMSAPAAVGGWDISIILGADPAQIQVLGRQIVQTVALSVGAVLIVPFVIFGILGRRTLVAPHIALERSQATLRQQSKELAELAAIAENANDCIILTDLEGHITWVNPAFEALSGHKLEAIRGQRPGAFLQGPQTDQKEVARLSAALKAAQPVQAELVNYHKNGEIYWIHLSITPMIEDRRNYGYMAISHDITEARKARDSLAEANEQISRQAIEDALTGLPNRRGFDRELERRLATLEGSQEDALTIIRVDLDKFKYVNDTLGHEAGDFALQQTSAFLREAVGPTDFVARIGGDEFVVLLGVGRNVEMATKLSEAFRARVSQPMDFEGKLFQIGASCGIASSQDDLLDPEHVSVSADAALYEAKNLGRNRVELYSPALHCEVTRNRDIAAEIPLALVNREFTPYFQPQVDAVTHTIIGAETLVRWQNPHRGLLTPNLFLPVAGQMSVMEEIDEQVFETALNVLSDFARDGIVLPKISFNVTAPRLADPKILNITEKHAPAGTTVAFEILESVLLEDTGTEFKFHIDRLREAGIEIEIDDFGSGHASIIGLLHAQPDAMKIDGRLVAPIIDAPAYRRMVAAICEIGKAQNIRIVAEGVETLEQAVMLRDLGVDILQGYYFARPMDAPALRTSLLAQADHPAQNTGPAM